MYYLNISLEAKDRQERYALYETFNIGDEASLYTINIGGFSGTVAYDCLQHCDDEIFVTFDKDKTDFSTEVCKSGWWWCGYSNLNGIMKIGTSNNRDNTYWYRFFPNGHREALYKTRMTLFLKTAL